MARITFPFKLLFTIIALIVIFNKESNLVKAQTPAGFF